MATEARLAAGLRVAALLRQLDLDLIPAYVLARGDDTAGAILVKAAVRGTCALIAQEYDLGTGARLWRVTRQAPEAEIDAAIAAERRADRDLWVIEAEAPPEALIPRLQAL